MRRGFQLIESIISMGLLSFMGTAVLGMMLSCAQPTKQAIQREQAIQLVSSRFEEMKARELPVGELDPETVDWNGVSYKILVQVSEVSGYPTSLHKLTVEVRWNELSTQQIGWVSGARF